MNNDVMENEIVFIKLDDIIPNRFQPREVFDEVALNELAESIRQHGVIQPIVVRQVGNKYEIIAGERRYKASAIAGLTKIPAIIKNLDDKESSIVAYIENAQRRNVSAIEEARTSERILKSNNMTQEQLAHELGISQSALANKLRLLSLPMEVQESLMRNEISERHARSLLGVKEPEKQIELLNKIKSNKMTVRELDGEIRNMYGNNSPIFNSSDNNNYSEANSVSFINGGVSGNNFNTSNPTFNQPISTFDNNYNVNNLNKMEPVSPSTNQNDIGESDNDFLNFANNFDPSKYEKSYVEPIDNQVVSNPNTTTPNNSSFMDFINNYDNSFPAVSDSLVVNNETVASSNNANDVISNTSVIHPNETYSLNGSSNDFMSFLNNYQGPSPSELESSVNSNANINQNNVNNSAVSSDFNTFLSNYDQNLATSNGNQSSQLVNNQTVNSPIINDVIPPVTSNFTNDSMHYVENDARYHDISNPEGINSIDDIIAELQKTINHIKNSKFKIDTDEINFDDIYQITIKIDKRDFL